MASPSLIVTLAATLTAGALVEPGTGLQPRIEQVRLVCDQYCTCWRTRYQERRAMLADREDLTCTLRQPDRAHYNGYYRQGSATGLGFESREPVREFSFPF